MRPLIEINNLSFSYSRSDKPALDNINLSINRGEKILITGPAGSGKTTLCLCLNGLVPHYFRGKLRGEVIVDESNTRQSTISELSHKVGLLFQDPATQLVCPTVIDEVAFGQENYGVNPKLIRERAIEALEVTRLRGVEERAPQRLSGGQQQSVALASIIAMRPNIFVLDEPTSNLDPIGSQIILKLLTELATTEKRTIITVEHKLEELLPVIDRLIVLNKGKIILEGKPSEIINKIDIMDNLGLKVPQVTLLLSKMKKRDPDIKLTFNAMESSQIVMDILQNKRIRLNDIVENKYKNSNDIIVETKNLWHEYEGGTVALKGINLEIRKGECIGLIGQNGSGKTTLVKHFNGLLKPTKGSVEIFGVNTANSSINELSKKVGYCFQNPDHQLCCDTVEKELNFGPHNIHMPLDRIAELVKDISNLLGLNTVLDKNPFSLSKGERQKVAVGSILTMQPEILVVDEPTTGQDYETSKKMMQLYTELNNLGKTIIIITHDMNLVAEYTKRAVVLKDGKVLLDGITRDVFSKSRLLKTTYIKPPQVTELGEMLGLNKTILSVDEMYKTLNKGEDVSHGL